MGVSHMHSAYELAYERNFRVLLWLGIVGAIHYTQGFTTKGRRSMIVSEK